MLKKLICLLKGHYSCFHRFGPPVGEYIQYYKCQRCALLGKGWTLNEVIKRDMEREKFVALCNIVRFGVSEIEIPLEMKIALKQGWSLDGYTAYSQSSIFYKRAALKELRRRYQGKPNLIKDINEIELFD